MIPILEFVFSSFWTWLGTFFLILAFRPVRMESRTQRAAEDAGKAIKSPASPGAGAP